MCQRHCQRKPPPTNQIGYILSPRNPFKFRLSIGVLVTVSTWFLYVYGKLSANATEDKT